jgi:superfamily I DNA/RNA helicase
VPYYFKLPQIIELTIGQQAALNEPKAIAISGGPGTGKSVVSLWRHIRNHSLGKKRSLLLTYTRTLETYLSSSAKSESAAAGNAVSRTYWWTTHNPTNYDEIIIDEAQDVEATRYDVIKRYAGIISYGADDQQIVYANRSTSQSQLLGIFPANNGYVLDENFRNSYEIMVFVRGLFPSKLIPQSTINLLMQKNRRGNKPILLVTNHDAKKQSKAILDIIKEFRSGTHNIAVLVPLIKHVNHYYDFLQNSGVACSKYVSDDEGLDSIDNIHITTFKSSKGTEFDTVIIPDFENMQSNISRLNVIEENDYYVGITRARRNLYLIGASAPAFLERSIQQTLTYTKEIL